MEQNKKFFWIICFVTVIGAIFWSAMFTLRQPKPIFTVFLIVNIVSLAVNTVCFIIDKKKK